MGGATGLQHPTTMSKGMAWVKVDKSSDPSDSRANRPTGSEPSSGTVAASTSHSVSIRDAASANAPGAGVDVTVSCISLRTAVASSSRPPPLQGRPRGPSRRGASGTAPVPGASAMGPGESCDVDGMGVEHLQDLGAGPGRDPQHDLVEAEAFEVCQFGLSRNGPERDHPNQVGVPPGVPERLSQPRECLAETRPADGHPPIGALGDGRDVAGRRSAAEEDWDSGLLHRLRPAPAWVEVHELPVVLGRVVAPQRLHAQDVLACDGPAVAESHTVVGCLLAVPPEADAEHYPPATQVIE